MSLTFFDIFFPDFPILGAYSRGLHVLRHDA